MEQDMKYCPMCGTSRSDSTVCWYCDFEEKPLEELSKEEIDELMAPYEYEWIQGGARIKSVKNARSMHGKIPVPHFVTEIAPNAFADCKFLTRILLPAGLTSIGDGAFAYCRDLFDVFIPESVGYIGKGAFSNCFELGVICAAAPEKPDGWDSEGLADCSARVEWSAKDE